MVHAPTGEVGVAIVGGGLAGALLALALRQDGSAVALVDPRFAAGGAAGAIASATAISYGAMPGWALAPTPLARLAAGASRRWRRLQEHHGDLGWRPQRLSLHGERSGLSALTRALPLPFAQVDTAVLAARLPQVLAAAGVQLIPVVAAALAPAAAGQGWRLQWADGGGCHADQVVLAAGAWSRTLWPALPERLRCSWAAVLDLPVVPAGLPAKGAWLPQRFARVALERRAPELEQPHWLVDPGLVPRGEGALLGQLSLIRPGGALDPAPAAEWLEQQLRSGLAADAWGAAMAAQPGVLRQAPVAFCTGRAPLVGPVEPEQGLWVFCGFSAGFSQVPVLAPLLAQRLVAPPPRARRAERRLQQLGVWTRGG